MTYAITLTQDSIRRLMEGEALNDRGPFGLTITAKTVSGNKVNLSVCVTDSALERVSADVFSRELSSGDSITIQKLANLFNLTFSQDNCEPE